VSDENLPHVVYSKEYPYTGIAWVCPNYKAAHDRWLAQHTWQTPYLINVIGREKAPATPVIDPNE
jgi:hypothetical protein